MEEKEWQTDRQTESQIDDQLHLMPILYEMVEYWHNTRDEIICQKAHLDSTYQQLSVN